MSEGYYTEEFKRDAVAQVTDRGLFNQGSGCVYGYRKIHHDLLGLVNRCSPNRVARLAQVAGIKAQVGYKRKTGSYGGKPEIVATDHLKQNFSAVIAMIMWWLKVFFIYLKPSVLGAKPMLHAKRHGRIYLTT